MNKLQLLNMSDNLENKIKALESSKQYLTSSDFIDKDSEEQLEYIYKIKNLKLEISELKLSIDNLEKAHKDLQVDHKELTERLARVIQDGDLWLGDVLEIEAPEFGSNNLILAPVGSGKSFTIYNNLASKYGKYQLMLVPTNHLKNSIAPDTRNSNKRKEDQDNVFTTRNKSIYGDKDYKIHVMTYSEFGARIRNNDNFITDNNIDVIYCDEIHSLVEYKNYNGDESLTHAMRYLLQRQEGVTLYYFTATTEHLSNLYKRDKDKFEDIKIFNYLRYKNIKKYTNKSLYEINHLEQLREYLKAHSGDFQDYGYKGLAYHKTITGQKAIASMLEEEGFKPLVLWSTQTASEHGDMNTEQLRALGELIDTQQIPEGYDFLVINSAMREGWNLNDDRVEVAIINTISETDQVQARGRIRKNISTLILRIEEEVMVNDNIKLSNKYINKELTNEDKEELSKELNIVDQAGNTRRWTTIKNLLLKQGFTIKDVRRVRDGERFTVSIITKS